MAEDVQKAEDPLLVDPVREFPFLSEHPEYDSPAKRQNLGKLIEARLRGDEKVRAMPAYIRFEPHAKCNLSCCWAQRQKRHPSLRPRGVASVALAEQVVKQAEGRLYQVILCHWGEPLLNPDLPDIVRVFHGANIYTTLDTNMTLMTEPLAEALIEAGLDRISASIDGVSQAAYGQYRVGGKVDRALAGMRVLIEQRRRCEARDPWVRWQYLVFPHNVDEVQQAEQLAAEIGVDELDIFGASGRKWSRDAGFVPHDPPKKPDGVLCDDPWMYLAVDWDGAVHLCCKAFQAKHLCGDLREASLAEVFDNERFQLARRVVRDGKWTETDGAIPCTGCNHVTRFVPEIAQLGHTLGLEENA